MALITRVARLFKADFHAVLDRVEEPQMLLKQAIREMEDALAEEELRQHHLLIERDDLKLRQQDLAATLEEIDEELDICFESNEEKLARELIKRKLQTQNLSKRVNTRFVATEKTLAALQQNLLENRTALESMRQKSELFAERVPSCNGTPANGGDFACRSDDTAVSDNDIEVAFLREKKRRSES